MPVQRIYIFLVCRSQAQRGLREVFVEARWSKSLGDFLKGPDTDPLGSLQHLCSADGDQREGEQGREGLFFLWVKTSVSSLKVSSKVEKDSPDSIWSNSIEQLPFFSLETR